MRPEMSTLPTKELDELYAHIEELENVAKLANTFFEDVLPQVGKLCIQRYDLLNELGMKLTKLMKEGTI